MRHTHFPSIPKQLQARFFKTSHIDKEQPININATVVLGCVLQLKGLEVEFFIERYVYAH